MWEHTVLLQPCKTIKAAPMDIVDFNEVVAYSLVFNVGFHTISCSCPIKANADCDLWVVLIFVEMVGKILHLCSYIAHIAVVNHIPQKQKHCRHTYIFHCIQHRCSKSNSPKSPSINLTCLIESIIAFLIMFLKLFWLYLEFYNEQMKKFCKNMFLIAFLRWAPQAVENSAKTAPVVFQIPGR